MAKPKGYKVPKEERDKIAASQRERWAERRPWVEVSGAILNAANTGDRETASQLLHGFMDERQAEYRAASSMQAMDQAEKSAAIAEMGRELDELFAETRRLQEGRRTRKAISDEDIEQFRKMLLRDVKAILAMTSQLYALREPSPYDGIPTPTQRRAADRARRSEI